MKWEFQRTQQFRPSPGTEVLYDLYVRQGKGVEELLRHFHTWLPALRRWLREAGIPMREPGRSHQRREFSEEDLRRLYVAEDHSLNEVAALLHTTPKIVLRELRRHGIPSRRFGPRPRPRRRRPLSDKGNYTQLFRPDHPEANSMGYVREHRVVAESVLGRPLRPGEVVHHKDGDPTNNRPENLEVFPSLGEHRRFHNLERSSAGKLHALDNEALLALYLLHGSTVKLAAAYGTSAATVGRLLRRRGFRLGKGRRGGIEPPTPAGP